MTTQGRKRDKGKKKKMGAIVTNFPDIDATMQITWSDANLRLRQVIWTINSAASVRVVVIRDDIPATVYDRIITGPADGVENIAGTFTMEWYSDPEYPEEPPRLRFPQDLRVMICKV